MFNKFKLIAAFLTVPLASFSLLSGSLSKLENGWNQALQRSVPADRAPDFALSRACVNVALRHAVDISAVCSASSNIQGLRTLALWLGTLPILLAASLMIAGTASKASRNTLHLLFRPGFVVSNLLVAILLVGQGLLLSGTVLYALTEGAKNDDFYFYSGLFGLIALLGVFFTIKPLFARRRATVSVIGRCVHGANYPKLWRFVKNLADETGAECPENLVVGLTPNFFVTEADVYCIGKKLTGRTMYLSLPLCRLLMVEELSAVIVHELAHFKGEDTAFSLNFYPVYRGTVASIHGVAQTANNITRLGQYIPIAGIKLIALLGSLTLFPSLYMLTFFLECFAGAENAISREREIAADALAAANTAPLSIGTALVKIHAFSAVWGSITSVMRDALLAGYIDVNGERHEAQRFFANVCELFANTAGAHAQEPSILNGLDVTTIPHPTDSHPPLGARLAALGKDLAELRNLALNVSPDIPSSEVIDDCEALELELSAVERGILGPKQRLLEETALAS